MKKDFFAKVCISISAVVVLLILLVGCSGIDTSSDMQGSIFDSNIYMVKNGYPEIVPDITYEEAYDYFFANPKWRGFEAEDGSDVVEFCGEFTYCDEEAKAYIQFVIEDDDSFSLYYAEITVGDEKFDADEKTLLDLVYVPFETYSREVLSKELDQDAQDAFAEIYSAIE